VRRAFATVPGGLDEGLQADVMRFMAIIAFCLVAIMALARNAGPLEASASAPTPAAGPDRIVEVRDAMPDPAGVSVPAVAVPSATQRPATQRPAPERPAAERPVAEASYAEAPAALGRELPQPPVPGASGRPEVPGAPASRRRVAVGDAVVPAAPIDPSPAAPAPSTDRAAAPEATAGRSGASSTDAGLGLRFASDGDFMRLVGRRAIEVYAYREDEVLALSPGLGFAPAPGPGRIHELLPATIPGPIGAALAAARPDAAAFAWGVRMPGRIERRIREHVDAGASGVLVIDRFGEVHLRAGRSGEESAP
jgi:hypothetical protein